MEGRVPLASWLLCVTESVFRILMGISSKVSQFKQPFQDHRIITIKAMKITQWVGFKRISVYFKTLPLFNMFHFYSCISNHTVRIIASHLVWSHAKIPWMCISIKNFNFCLRSAFVTHTSITTEHFYWWSMDQLIPCC